MSTPKQPAPPASSPAPAKQPDPSGAQPPAKKSALVPLWIKLHGVKVWEPGTSAKEQADRTSQAMKNRGTPAEAKKQDYAGDD